MKITHLRIFGLWLTGCVGVAVFAQSIPSDNPPPFDKLPPPTADDLAWDELLTTKKSAEKSTGQLPHEANARKQAKADRAAKHATLADKAKAFYTARSNYYWADEARRLEILSLIQTEEDGDDSVDKRLAKAVKDLRADTQVSSKIRAQGAAAYEFTRAVHGANGESARRNAIEKTARKLIAEFPTEAPGYEALLALSKAGHGGSAKTAQMAKEIAGSQAPAEIKSNAQILADCFALVGTSLASALGSEGTSLISRLPTDQPVIVYSWATWGPGSIELGRMIQARRFAAIGICVLTTRS